MRLIHDAIQDLRYAVRVLRRSPGAALIVVLSLGLGIGANTAIFSVIDALMLRALPVPHPEELVVLVRSYSGRGTADYITYPAFERFRDSGVFASITASMTVTRSGVHVNGVAAPDSSTLQVGLVSGSYFSTFGVRAAFGRTLTPEDDGAAGGAPVAVISDPCWRRRFAAAPDAVGRTLVLNGTTFTIVGVAEPSYTGEDVGQTTDLWIPIAAQSQVMVERPGLLQNPDSNWIRAIARLKPGLSLTQAESAARTIFAALPAVNSGFGTPRLDLAPAGRGFTPQREFLATPLAVLAVAVGLVLVIACANVAMLMLARAAARQREIALRFAIGARRGRLVRQLLAESLLIVGLSGACGFVAAVWMTHVLVWLAGSGRASLGLDVPPDARLLGVTAVVSLATGLLFGVLPAFRATRVSLRSALTGSGGAESGVSGASLRGGGALVVAQVATSIVLTIGAGLVVRTLRNLETQDVGFDRDHVWMFWMAPSESGRQGAALAPLFAAAQERVAAVPGVVSVSPSTDGVLSGFVGLRAVAAEGHIPALGEDVNAQWNLVGPKFFDTIGMRLVAGRDFGPRDTEGAPPVAVVNESMARRFFGEANPIGKRFGFGRDLTRRIEIVGVVRDAKYFSARDSAVSMVFLPYQQDVAHVFRMCLVVRTASAAPGLITRIRDELREIDPAVPVRLVNTTSDQLDRSLSDERLTAWLAGFFGLLAVLLACIGLYGVLSYGVTRRTREIGVRMALGETRAGILTRVVREGLVLVAVGLVIGVPAAMLGTRSVQALLFGVTPTDPMTMVFAAGLLVGVAVLATIAPARRASAVDPIVALRTE